VGGVGPALAGMISDSLQPALGPNALGRAMLLVPVFQTLAAILYATAIPFFTREIVDER